MLVRFLQACHESGQLYEHFFFSIYKPLSQLFADKKAASLEKELGRVLKQWSSLLAPGPINHRMLSAESSEAVHNMNLTNKPRDAQFNLILRLVPDFAVKGYLALSFARQWRNILGSSGYSRELKFIHSKKRWASTQEQPSDSAITRSTLYNLEGKLKQFREREEIDSTGHVKMEHARDKTSSRDHEMCGTDLKFDSLKTNERVNENCSSSILLTPGSRGQRIDLLWMGLKREQIKVQRIKTEILQGEITSRCTAEKTMVGPLLDSLAVAKTNCWRLRNEISKEERNSKSNFAVHGRYNKRLDLRSSVQTCQTGLASVASERIRLVTRALLNSRHRAQTRHDQGRFCCKVNLR